MMSGSRASSLGQSSTRHLAVFTGMVSRHWSSLQCCFSASGAVTSDAAIVASGGQSSVPWDLLSNRDLAARLLLVVGRCRQIYMDIYLCM